MGFFYVSNGVECTLTELIFTHAALKEPIIFNKTPNLFAAGYTFTIEQYTATLRFSVDIDNRGFAFTLTTPDIF